MWIFNHFHGFFLPVKNHEFIAINCKWADTFQSECIRIHSRMSWASCMSSYSYGEEMSHLDFATKMFQSWEISINKLLSLDWYKTKKHKTNWGKGSSASVLCLGFSTAKAVQPVECQVIFGCRFSWKLFTIYTLSCFSSYKM